MFDWQKFPEAMLRICPGYKPAGFVARTDAQQFFFFFFFFWGSFFFFFFCPGYKPAGFVARTDAQHRLRETLLSL
ncbi:hypothetical protein BI322_07955 [Klebsiella oxytoca]|nr:hypothetical protein BI322_07955 [Klebsiella oxytoca]